MVQPETILVDLPGSYKYLNVIGACLSEFIARIENISDPAGVVYNVQLAVHEVCTNIINHAYGDQQIGRIRVEVTLADAPRHLLIAVHDTGQAFDLDQVPEISLDDVHIHGYGLFLIRELMDQVTYLPQHGNNYWHLIKYI